MPFWPFLGTISGILGLDQLKSGQVKALSGPIWPAGYVSLINFSRFGVKNQKCVSRSTLRQKSCWYLAQTPHTQENDQHHETPHGRLPHNARFRTHFRKESRKTMAKSVFWGHSPHTFQKSAKSPTDPPTFWTLTRNYASPFAQNPSLRPSTDMRRASCTRFVDSISAETSLWGENCKSLHKSVKIFPTPPPNFHQSASDNSCLSTPPNFFPVALMYPRIKSYAIKVWGVAGGVGWYRVVWGGVCGVGPDLWSGITPRDELRLRLVDTPQKAHEWGQTFRWLKTVS